MASLDSQSICSVSVVVGFRRQEDPRFKLSGYSTQPKLEKLPACVRLCFSDSIVYLPVPFSKRKDSQSLPALLQDQ